MNNSPPSVEGKWARVTRWLPALAVLVVVAAVSGVAINQSFRNQRERATARLEYTAELRANLIEAWLQRHMSLADYLDDSANLGSLYDGWQTRHDTQAGASLMRRALDARDADQADGVAILDAGGHVLFGERQIDSNVPPELRAALAQAIHGAGSVNTGFYRGGTAAAPTMHFDVVVPFLKTGPPPQGAMVFRSDPTRALFPLLKAGGGGGIDSSENALWDRVGDRLVALNSQRREVGTAAPPDQLLATSPLPVARYARGELAPGSSAIGIDYRGNQVLTVGLPVKGSGLWIIAKIDVAEVYAPAWERTIGILIASALVLLGAGLATRVRIQRRHLRHAVSTAAEQRERLRTLALLQAISQSASDAIYAKDLEGRYVFCNRAASAVIGIPADKVIGRSNTELFGLEFGARISANDQRAMAGELPEQFEETLELPGGTVIVLSTKGPLVDSTGKVIGMLGVSRDVTESVRAKQALSESEEHYRSVVSVLGEGIFVSDLEGRVVSCNAVAEQLIGLRSENWLGHSLIAPGWQPLRQDGTPMPVSELPAGRVLAGEGPQPRTIVNAIGPQGQAVVFQVSSVPIMSPHTGRMVSVASSFTDVTEQIRFEAELRQHRDALEALVAERTAALTAANASLETSVRFSREMSDAIPGLVSFWDHELRCRFANAAYLETIDKSADEVLGRTRAEIFRDGYANEMGGRLARALEGFAQRFEYEFVSSRGIRHFQVHYLPATAHDVPQQGVYMMAVDITALKQAEVLLKSTNDALSLSRDLAESATRAKSAFLANMSHEIRTPMNAIIGLTHLLVRDATDAAQRERLRKVGDSAQHLLRVIDDILDLSKVEAGKITLEASDFALETVLSRAIEMVKGRANEKGLELRLKIGALPPYLHGDETRLSQILINLLSNAVKFTQHGWVQLTAVLMAEVEDRLEVRFEVQDTGPGIAPAYQAGLFEPFAQGDNSISRQHGGTGLGLALSRQLAAALGGEVGVTSAPGAGSTFWFTARLGRSREPGQGIDAVHARDIDAAPSEAAVGADAGADRAGTAPPLNTSMLLALFRDLAAGEEGASPPPAGTAFDEIGEAEATLRATHFGQRVLLAEDNAVNREVAEELLRSAGLVVESVFDGAHAVALALEKPFDLVLMDLQMPVMDGLEATRTLRHRLGGALPIVAMTANAFHEDRIACLEAGMNDHVGKPVTPSVLYETLLRWLPSPGTPTAAGGAPSAAPASTPVAAAPSDAPARAAAPPGLETESAMRERLHRVDGFDLEVGLGNVGSQWSVLRRVLQRFIQTYRLGAPALLEESGDPAADRDKWQRCCHSLRGALVTVGATGLVAEVGGIEQLMNRVPPAASLDGQGEQLHAHLIAMVAELDAALNATA